MLRLLYPKNIQMHTFLWTRNPPIWKRDKTLVSFVGSWNRGVIFVWSALLRGESNSIN